MNKELGQNFSLCAMCMEGLGLNNINYWVV